MVYTAASYLTDPACTAHRYFRELLITDDLYSNSWKVTCVARKGFLLVGIVFNGSLAIITAPLGALMRFIAITLQSQPFSYSKGTAHEEDIPSTFKLFSWNVCCVAGGYSITDGGVLPWSYRILQLIDHIQQQNAEVVCLYEVFDIQTAHRLIDGLKSEYAHFYYNIGQVALGNSSGMFVASKFKVTDPRFTPFPQEALDGRAKWCGKGVFSFDVEHLSDDPAMRIFTTHMQHSEVPIKSTDGEVNARSNEIQIILEEMQKAQKTCIFTGDLNLDENEFNSAKWSQHFNRGNFPQGPTWGGDQYMATLMAKSPSTPAVLDYTMLYDNSSTTMLKTVYVETGYDGTQFNLRALSDHKGLLSTINYSSQP